MIQLIIALVVLGLILYAIKQLPIESWIKTVITVLVILIVILWLVQAFGLAGMTLGTFPRFR